MYPLDALKAVGVDMTTATPVLNALDVFEEEPTKDQRIYTHERISLTPHIGASTIEAQARIGLETIECSPMGSIE